MPNSKPAVPPGWPAGAACISSSRSVGLDICEACTDFRCAARWSGRLDSNQRPPHPQCDALPGCATPRPGWRHLGRATIRQGAAGGRVARRRRKAKRASGLAGMLAALLAVPALYLVAALVGSLVPVNRGWTEPAQGTTDLPRGQWHPRGHHHAGRRRRGSTGARCSRRRLRSGDPTAGWIAFGAGEQRVYLDTPTWWDITPRTLWSALAGGKRVMHVEYVPSPDYAVRQIRLRPEEYRRLWAAIRADFELDATGRPQRIDHPRLRPVRRLLSRDRQGERDPAPATAGSPDGFGLPGSRPACGRRSRRARLALPPISPLRCSRARSG